jgi:co-chaperonin GroES (HSP10)|tara:strand:- start:374 stop:631 length:258 start_codon:yes stop_codon:yes gene_type:complete
MRAINNFVIIDKLKEERKTESGLLLTETTDTDNRYLRAKVISCGNLVEGLSEGDIIRYDKHAGFGIDHKDKMYYVITIRDVVVVE